jgi:hypothetical protein
LRSCVHAFIKISLPLQLDLIKIRRNFTAVFTVNYFLHPICVIFAKLNVKHRLFFRFFFKVLSRKLLLILLFIRDAYVGKYFVCITVEMFTYRWLTIVRSTAILCDATSLVSHHLSRIPVGPHYILSETSTRIGSNAVKTNCEKRLPRTLQATS